jgi:hypothetical protein
MQGREDAWLELRVNGEEIERFGANELDSAVAAADALLESAIARTVEIYRCTTGLVHMEPVMLLRHAPVEQPEA